LRTPEFYQIAGLTACLPDAEPGQPIVENPNVLGALEHLQLTDAFFSELGHGFADCCYKTENVTQKDGVISKTYACFCLLLHIPANFRRPVMLIAEH
jgi:hypothetical protein